MTTFLLGLLIGFFACLFRAYWCIKKYQQKIVDSDDPTALARWVAAKQIMENLMGERK